MPEESLESNAPTPLEGDNLPSEKAKIKTFSIDVRLTEAQIERLDFQAEENGVLRSVAIRTVVNSGLDVEDAKIQARISLENSIAVRRKLQRRTKDIQAAIASLEKQQEESPSEALAATIILLKSAV
jgi:hypothetical protein